MVASAFSPSLIPMQPTLTRPFHRPGWIYEEKYDGWRILAFKNCERVRLVSRTGTEHSRTFPRLAAAIAALPADKLVLDGEVRSMGSSSPTCACCTTPSQMS